jgi:hypothetical protein
MAEAAEEAQLLLFSKIFLEEAMLLPQVVAVEAVVVHINTVPLVEMAYHKNTYLAVAEAVQVD